MRKKRTLVQKGRKGLSIRKQCKLLGISGNAVYYKPKGERPENEITTLNGTIRALTTKPRSANTKTTNY